MTTDDRHIIRLRKVDSTSSPRVEPEQTPKEEVTAPAPIITRAEIKKHRNNLSLKNIVILIVIAVVFLGALNMVGKSLWKHEASDASPNVGTQVPMGDQDALENVKKLMLVPDEPPAIAVVKDLLPLKDQQFFKNAQLGDYVFMFPKAQKAVLYRPSENRIIEVAPIISN